jgi:cytosine/adenosine deaminase-related metal-dependent hydrolase
MFMYRRGPLFEWLGSQRSMDDCGSGSPVRHCARAGLFKARCLAVHVNYLWHGDADLLAAAGVSVVHCPRSHAYFHHRQFPREELALAGVNICLGTDSLASMPRRAGGQAKLSMFEEMQSMADADAKISSEDILGMATINGARALGLEGRAGALTPGAIADLAAIPYDGALEAAVETIVRSGSAPSAVLASGHWVQTPGRGLGP